MKRDSNRWLQLLLVGLLVLLGYLQTYHTPQRSPDSPPQSQVSQARAVS